MSFTSIVKTEVSKIIALKQENIAELSAIVHNNEKTLEYIRIYTENSSVARKVYTLFKDLYNDVKDKIPRPGKSPGQPPTYGNNFSA